MTPDPEQRLPRELLKELIEEGSDAFEECWRNCSTPPCRWNEKSFWELDAGSGASSVETTPTGTRPRRCQLEWDSFKSGFTQVRHLDFYPRSLERGCRSEKALKLAIAEMYVMGVSTRKVTEITEQLCGTEISASQVSRISKLLDDELEQFRNRPLGSYPVV